MRKLIGLVITIWLGLVFGNSMVVAGETPYDVTSVASAVSTNTIVNNFKYEPQIPVALPVEYVDQFEDKVFDLYLEQSVNYCEHCDYYYYENCNCNACYSDCADCSDYDYELFIADNYDLIMEYYDEFLSMAQGQFLENQEEEHQLCFKEL